MAEADESDGTFIKLPSTIGAINNIDLEHLDFYKDINEIKKSFIEYANKIPFYGFLVINIDDKNVNKINANLKKYGIPFIIVSHNQKHLKKCEKVFMLSKGNLIVQK